MLLVFGLAAVEAIRLLDEMREENHILRQESLDRAHKLATVRYCIQLSQQYVTEHARRERLTSEADVRNQWMQMMAQLKAWRFLNDGDASRFAELQGLLQQHWVILSRAMDGELEDADVQPLGVSALRITAQVEDIDAKQNAATELSIQDEFEHLGRGLGLALNLALATALLLAIACAAYILRIERQNQRRYAEIVSARRDLEQLSARLVDAQENERRTISRELHDQVGQTLNAVLVDAANLAPRIPADDEIGQRYLNNIRSYTDASVNSIRDISQLLRPSMLDDLGLIPALEWQARETSRRTHIDVRVSAENVADSLPDVIRTCIYRVAQEALQNVARHSKASHATVGVRQVGDAVTLTVEDDGQGFDQKRTRGMGLVGIEERIRQLGGKLEILSELGKGTSIRATLPLQAAIRK